MSRLGAALLALSLSACAVRGGSLPERSVDALPKNGVEVGYELRARQGGIEDPRLVSFYRSRVESLLPRAFDSVRTGAGEAPLTLKFSFDDTADPDLNSVSMVIAQISLSAIPTYFRGNYTLDVEAIWEGGPPKAYHYDATFRSFVWLPLFPVMLWRSPTEVSNAAVDNMIANFLFDLSADLPYMEQKVSDR